MFAGVSCFKNSLHHDLYKFRLLCHNAPMSTLCRANWNGQRNVSGARPSRSLCGASRAALPDKDVFGGTPDTARETHALPTHLSAFLKGWVKRDRKISDNPKNFGNISEKQPFSEIISDYFFWGERDRPGRCAGRPAPHFRTKAGQSRSKSVKPILFVKSGANYVQVP